MFGRTKIAAVVAEFLGAATITTVMLAISKSGVGFSFFIASGVGLALGLLVLTVGTASSGYYNPAITVGLWTVRKLRTEDAVVALAAQFLGAVGAWKLIEYLNQQTLHNIAGNHFDWHVFVAEAVGTFVFGFGVAAAVYRGLKGLEAAAVAGVALMLGVVVASLASNGLINPAVALGVRSWNWAYTLGPLAGALVGANLYGLLFSPVPLRWSLPGPVAAQSRPRPSTTTRRRSTRRRR